MQAEAATVGYPESVFAAPDQIDPRLPPAIAHAIVIRQGEDMGVACRIDADISATIGDGNRVAGAARFLNEDERR